MQTPEKDPNSIRIENDSVKKHFDEMCLKVAEAYNLFYSNGKPQKARIIEILTKTSCTSCLDKMLRKTSKSTIDSFYSECHALTINLLIEELHSKLVERGYKVSITSEDNKGGYGKIDVLLIPNHTGINLHFNKKQIAVEVKTGQSFALPQLFRYLLDNEDRILLLWRVKNRQILSFEGPKLKPLITQFMKMVVSRSQRVITNKEISCEHPLSERNWSPSQEQLQEAFSDFSKGIIETLPVIVETALTMLDKEAKRNGENLET